MRNFSEATREKKALKVETIGTCEDEWIFFFFEDRSLWSIEKQID
jgi:hypothetical protein